MELLVKVELLLAEQREGRGQGLLNIFAQGRRSSTSKDE